jgi:glycosyltransferase involved in cell wall biosynthesis
MRIAYVCADSGVPVFGRKGCSVHVQEMIRAFRRGGAQVEIFAAAAEGSPPPELDGGGLRIHRLPAVSAAGPGGTAVEVLNRAIAAGLSQAGTFDLVYERYSLWSAAAMEHARAAGVPGVLEVNAPLIEEQAEHRGLRDTRGAAAIAGRVFSAATALLAVSAEVAAWLGRQPGGGARGRVHLVPNGVDPQRFRPDVRPALPPSPGSFTVGFVGSMKRWHGLAVLIEACALLHERVPASRLLLVGDGPELAAIRVDLAQRGLTNATHLTGSAAPEDVPALLTSMDAAAAPYPDAKGFYFSPLKVYEYLASGRAVVASRVGQVAAIMRHEIDGLLCPPGDAAPLAAALERLHNDPALRARLGAAARANAVEHHSWDARAATIIALARAQAVEA